MAANNSTLKPRIVLILGILFSLYMVTSNIYNYKHGAPTIYLNNTYLQYVCMVAAMILANYRKKIPALALTILAVMICLVNQYILTYGDVDPFYRTLYYMLEYILLIVYILIRDDKKRDSLIWCGVFIFATGYSVYEIAKVLSIKDLVFLTLYMSFYLVGYSPNKWYKRKKVQESEKT